MSQAIRINPQEKHFIRQLNSPRDAASKAWKNTSASMTLQLIKILGRVGRTRVALVPKWDTVPRLAATFAKWFVGGKINIPYNCLDRHLTTWRKNKAA